VKRRVELLAGAKADLVRLAAWLLDRDPKVAGRAAEALIEAVSSLSEYSERGRPRNDTSYRELFVPFGRDGYFVRYRVETTTVFVTRIFHSLERR